MKIRFGSREANLQLSPWSLTEKAHADKVASVVM